MVVFLNHMKQLFNFFHSFVIWKKVMIRHTQQKLTKIYFFIYLDFISAIVMPPFKSKSLEAKTVYYQGYQYAYDKPSADRTKE